MPPECFWHFGRLLFWLCLVEAYFSFRKAYFQLLRYLYTISLLFTAEADLGLAKELAEEVNDSVDNVGEPVISGALIVS